MCNVECPIDRTRGLPFSTYAPWGWGGGGGGSSLLYGSCGSRKYRRFGRRAADVKNGNAGPKLHWLVWERSGFPALPCEWYFLAENNGHDGYERA